MSKINPDQFRAAIAEVLKGSEEKKRNFVESIEIQFCLKDFDPARDKRIGGSVKLPHNPASNFRFCILGDAHHCEEAKKIGVDFMDVEALKRLNKNKKAIKKLCKTYDAFIASQALIPTIPRLLPGLNKVGKFPTPCTHTEKIEVKMDEIRKTIRIASKKDINIGCAIANVTLGAEEVRQNALLAVNYIISQLKKNWSNVKTLVIKSSMGKPVRIYG